MPSICICLSTSSGLLSSMIRWVTRSDASHAVLTFRDETLDKVFVMEANGRGFMLVPWSTWAKGNKLVARFALTCPIEDQLMSLQQLAELLGSEYDYLSLPWFLLRRFFRRMRNPLSSTKKMVCSEAIAKFLHKTEDRRLIMFKDYASWVPDDIWSEAMINEAFMLVEPLS